jgi:hypothetical protein
MINSAGAIGDHGRIGAKGCADLHSRIGGYIGSPPDDDRLLAAHLQVGTARNRLRVRTLTVQHYDRSQKK